MDIIAWLVELLALSEPNSSSTCMHLNLMSTVQCKYGIIYSDCVNLVLYLETTCCTVVVTFTI